MNIALWIVQGLLALAFAGIGYNHAFKIENMKPMPGMGWINRVPPGLMTFIGFAEMAGGLGVLLPAPAVAHTAGRRRVGADNALCHYLPPSLSSNGIAQHSY